MPVRLSVPDGRLPDVIESNLKADLLRYLQDARDALLWKLDGLSEYDIRRPLTPTGTNLLGLVKHTAGVELGYFGDTFGRPFFGKESPPWWYTEDAEPNADMWATTDESREEIVGLYRRAWEHSNNTIATAGAGRDRSRPLVAGGAAEDHTAPHPGACDRRDQPARRPRRYRARAHRRGGRIAEGQRQHATG